jgi:NAD(P)H-hydrate epimerase
MASLPSHPVLTCAEARAWESRLLPDETAEWAAMQRAGAAIATAVAEDFREIGGLPANARLLVLAGKGHNGGDALLAAKDILKKYPQATADVLLCFGEAALRPLARRSLEELRRAAGSRMHETAFAALKAGLASYDVCLDGVFGFQFRPPIDDATAEILAWVNTHPRIRLRAAVDLPSGLGEENDGTVFRSDFTYATGIVKAPVLIPANASFVGRLRYLDLGFFKDGDAVPLASQHVLLPSILAPIAQLRTAQTDKRTYGHLFVVGGSRSYPGAVLMTVQAALRSGVGLLTAFVPASLVPEYASKFPEAMWVAWPETSTGGLAASGLPLLLEKLSRATALVIGPGLGTDPETLGVAGDIVRNTNIPLLLDADALRPEILRAAQGKRFICTPHAGEFQRIMSEPNWGEQGVLVLKGQPTQVSEGKEVYFSLFGGPVLARGGSGDMLAGLIGGLLAQTPDDLLLAAGRGVVWHGLAADLLARDKGQVAVQTTQLLDYLQPALCAAR